MLQEIDVNYRCERCGKVYKLNDINKGLCQKCYEWVFVLSKDDRTIIMELSQKIHEIWDCKVREKEG